LSRLIGRIAGAPGPTLIIVGGMHGNEPGGVTAARTVLARIPRDAVRGELVALAGNVRALAAHRRYLTHDLNRLWTPERVAIARGIGAFASDEQAELAELADELDDVITRARGPVYAIDLHTTSAAGVPFAVIGATRAHREFARALPLPGIVGLEETLDGVLTRYLGALGCITLAIEGGQTDSPATAANLEAVITVALSASGVLPTGVPDATGPHGLAAARELLARARGDLPTMIEVVSRRAVTPEDGFRMEPGFANIQRTTGGTLLARDVRSEIRAPFDGLVLLPLYQAQGSDGFFYGRAVED
jgi:succinylglutamate desuccinylase